MLRKTKNNFLLLWSISIIITLLLTNNLSAQQSTVLTDSRIVSEYFDQVFGADERLISGSPYRGAMRGSVKGHPYFSDEDWKPGSIEVGGKLFEGLSLNYDVLNNQIIMMHTTTSHSSYEISLRSSNITRITMGKSIFIPVSRANDSLSMLYGELLVEGELQYLLTSSKTVMIVNGAGDTDYKYSEKRHQYLKTGDQLIIFRNKKTLTKLYPELHAQLTQYARKNGLYLSPRHVANRAIWVNYCNDLLKIRQ